MFLERHSFVSLLKSGSISFRSEFILTSPKRKRLHRCLLKTAGLLPRQKHFTQLYFRVKNIPSVCHGVCAREEIGVFILERKMSSQNVSSLADL